MYLNTFTYSGMLQFVSSLWFIPSCVQKSFIMLSYNLCWCNCNPSWALNLSTHQGISLFNYTSEREPKLLCAVVLKHDGWQQQSRKSVYFYAVWITTLKRALIWYCKTPISPVNMLCICTVSNTRVCCHSLGPSLHPLSLSLLSSISRPCREDLQWFEPVPNLPLGLDQLWFRGAWSHSTWKLQRPLQG